MLDELRRAVRARLVSEVPLGAFLSGGVDSSAIVGLMTEEMNAPVKTFSIGFADDDFDELDHARVVAERFETDHHEFRVDPDAISIMPRMARHYGEPFADPSGIPSFYLSELAGKHVTVALNGDGGDESFAGYTRYLANRWAAGMDRLPGSILRAAPRVASWFGEGARSDSFLARLQRLARAGALGPDGRYAYWMSAFTPEMRKKDFQPAFLAALGDQAADRAVRIAWAESSAASPVDRMLDVDIKTYLPGDLLVKMDIASMAASVEARSPFLDHHLMEFAATLPAEMKLGANGQGKSILKSALRGLLPDSILYRKKMGFGVPLRSWFREELRHIPAEVLLDRDSACTTYVRRDALVRMINEHQEARADHSLRLWVLLQLEHWHREVLRAPFTDGLETIARGAAGSSTLTGGA